MADGRVQVVHVRVSALEWGQVWGAAQDAGMSLSEWARDTWLAQVQRQERQAAEREAEMARQVKADAAEAAHWQKVARMQKIKGAGQ